MYALAMPLRRDGDTSLSESIASDDEPPGGGDDRQWTQQSARRGRVSTHGDA
jgi:hypothetical protein